MQRMVFQHQFEVILKFSNMIFMLKSTLHIEAFLFGFDFSLFF
jgi:hypothetical protein